MTDFVFENVDSIVITIKKLILIILFINVSFNHESRKMNIIKSNENVKQNNITSF